MSQSYFSSREEPLARAIEADSEAAISTALSAGAQINAAGQYGMTPLMFAVIKRKPTAVRTLLAAGADPNIKSSNGDTAVTLAPRAGRNDLTVIRMLLEAKGDASARMLNNEPILVTYIADFNLEAIRLLAKHGADLNALDRTGTPLIVGAGQSDAWDVVWVMIELGADYRAARPFPGGQSDIAASLRRAATLPDSPLWPYKVKVWQFLKDKGVPGVPAELPTTAPKPRPR